MALTTSHVAGPTTPAVREMTFGDLLRRAADAAPGRLALIAGVADPAQRRQWTYAQFYEEAQRTARALLTRFKPGERIAVWAQNLPEWMMLEFGAGMAGMVLVTVNPAFRANEVQYVLKQSRSAGIFVVNNFRGNPMLETVQAVKPNCPELREVICFDDWNSFIAAGDDESIKLPAVTPDDPVMIQYTSGTTGFPKGALLRHRGLLNNGADTADRMGYRFRRRLRHHHAAVSHRRLRLLRDRVGLQGGNAGADRGVRSRAGAGNVRHLSRQRHGRRPHHADRDAGASEFPDHGPFLSEGDLLRRVHRAGTAGRRLEEKLGAPFTIVFGQTECSPVAAQTCANDSVEDKADTIGLPLPNMETKIIDPNTGETVPIGTIGEFCTRGYHVMLGYFEMPDATAAAIDADGWLHTGDSRHGRARILHRPRAAEGHDHPRRREHLPARTGRAAVQAPQGRRGRRDRRSPRTMGRGGRSLHPSRAGRLDRQGRADRVHARLARAAQDAKALVRRGSFSTDRIWKNSEIQVAGSLDQRRDDGDLIRRLQPVTDPGFGQHELRPLRVGLDLLAELAHIDAQILRIDQFVPHLPAAGACGSAPCRHAAQQRRMSYSLGESLMSSSPSLTIRRTRSTDRSPRETPAVRPAPAVDGAGPRACAPAALPCRTAW